MVWGTPLLEIALFTTSALTPDGGLINGVGQLSQGKHLKAEQNLQAQCL